jgi:hypothetical protein
MLCPRGPGRACRSSPPVYVAPAWGHHVRGALADVDVAGRSRPARLASAIRRGLVLATELIRRDRRGLRCPAVVDVKPTEHARDYDRLGRVVGHHGARRHALAKPLVRATLVEIGDEVPDQAKQVALVEDNDVVEELSADASDPTFDDAILPWASWSCAGRLRAEGLHGRDDLSGVDGVTVEDEVTRSGVKRERLAQLHDPRRIGMVVTWK